MKFGIRTPSLKRRIAARTSIKRVVRHSMGLKAPRGYGWITNPKKAAYNRIYNRTTISADKIIVPLVGSLIGGIASLFSGSKNKTNSTNQSNILCPRCNSDLVLREGSRGKFYGCSRFTKCRGTREYVPNLSENKK